MQRLYNHKDNYVLLREEKGTYNHLDGWKITQEHLAIRLAIL
jgi:hypothetical protein